MLITSSKIRPASENFIAKLSDDPTVRARLSRIVSINSQYEVPNISAISEDGKVVFLDKHFKSVLNGVDITKAIKVHEVVEKAVLDLFPGTNYEQAHAAALHFEQRCVEALGLKWAEYRTHVEFYSKTLKECQTLPPSNRLYMAPFVGIPYEYQKLTAKEKIGIAETKISLQYHLDLNPKLWHGFELKTDVRDRLLAIGWMFADYCHIPKAMVLDVIMTGGNANYNYTDKSDIDVHLIFSKEAMGWGDDIHVDYLKDKKTLWSIKHGITIYGFPIELYAQDMDEPAPAHQGVYSLLHNRWTQQPTRQEISFNDPLLKKKVMSYVHQIDAMIKTHADISAFKELRKKLKDMRASAIAKGGEYSFENLIFKELRNRGYLDKVNNHMKKITDQELSL